MKRKQRRRIFEEILIATLLAYSFASAGQEEVLKRRLRYDLVLVPVEIVRVIDGDTFVATFPGGKEERVRLECIDTPERGEEGFKEAGEALKKHLGGKTSLKIKRYHKHGNYLRDRYGRILAELYDPMPFHCQEERIKIRVKESDVGPPAQR